MAEDLPVDEDELRGPSRMPGGDLVGFDRDLESVRLRDPTDRVDDIGGFGPATLAPDAGQLRVAGDDARVVVGLVRHRGVDEIGRASCRERGEMWGGGGAVREKREGARR